MTLVLCCAWFLFQLGFNHKNLVFKFSQLLCAHVGYSHSFKPLLLVPEFLKMCKTSLNISGSHFQLRCHTRLSYEVISRVPWQRLQSTIMLYGSKFKIYRCHHLYVAVPKIGNIRCLALYTQISSHTCMQALLARNVVWSATQDKH